MSLPPMNHEHATTLAEQAALMGAEMWELIEDDELAPLMDHVLSALIYLHGYAQQVENRLVELLDSNKQLSALLEHQLNLPTVVVVDEQGRPVSSDSQNGVLSIPQSVIAPITGVAWRGDSGTYFDNMEEINHGLAQAISSAFGQPQHPSEKAMFDAIEADFAEIDPDDDHAA